MRLGSGPETRSADPLSMSPARGERAPGGQSGGNGTLSRCGPPARVKGTEETQEGDRGDRTMTTSYRKTEIGMVTRHTKTRQTGATVTTERTGPGSWIEQEPGWVNLCLDHGQLIHHRTRSLAERFHSRPAEWCSDCRRIVDGKRPRIDGPKVL